jgi:integrase
MQDIDKCLNGLSEGTKNGYRRGIKRFLEFTGCSVDELIKEAYEDRKRGKEKGLDIIKGKPEERINAFVDYLKSRDSKLGGKISSSEVSNCVKGVRKLYDSHGIKLNVPLPKISMQCKKSNFSPDDVKKLLDYCESLRDKAIILCLFQSGMRVGDLLNLNIGDLSMLGKEEPLKIDVYHQQKEETVSYFTFIGHDAINTLRRYLDAREKGMIQNLPAKPLRLSDPLFITEGRNKAGQRLERGEVAQMLRKLVVKCGLTTADEIKENRRNPYHPHQLRSAFRTQLAKSGIETDHIEFLMGHKVRFNRAYFDDRVDSVLEEYRKAEPRLNVVSGLSSDEKNELKWDILNDILDRTFFGLADKDKVLNEFCRIHNYSPKQVREDSAVTDRFLSDLGLAITNKFRRAVVNEASKIEVQNYDAKVIKDENEVVRLAKDGYDLQVMGKNMWLMKKATDRTPSV